MITTLAVAGVVTIVWTTVVTRLVMGYWWWKDEVKE